MANELHHLKSIVGADPEWELSKSIQWAIDRIAELEAEVKKSEDWKEEIELEQERHYDGQ